jgi:magnesium transporter
MLVNCVAYQNGRKLADIPIEDISEYVSRPDCFVWVAINDPTEGELEQMQEEFGLHELAVEDAKRPHQRPKLDEYGEDLFAVIRTVERDSPDGELIEGQVGVFVGRNYVLSVRQNVQKGFADVRERTEREPDLLRHGSGYVLYALMDAIVDRYFPVLDSLEEELERLEESIFRTTPTRASIEAFYDLEARGHGAQARGGAADGGRRQALRRPRAGAVRGPRRVLPRRLRPSVPRQRRDRADARDAADRDLGVVHAHQPERERDDQAARRVGRADHDPDADRGHLRHELPAHARAHWVFGYPFALALMVGVDAYLIYRFKKAGWL